MPRPSTDSRGKLFFIGCIVESYGRCIFAAHKHKTTMKKHTLKHGMTVRKPSHEDIDAIRQAGESAGIECEGFQHVKSGRYPNLWYYGKCQPSDKCITACVEVGDGRSDVKFMSADRFIKHINGQPA